MGPMLSDKLEQLREKVGGTIQSDGELYCGPAGREIYVSVSAEGGFWLASKRPLYVSKNGKTRLVRRRSNGWYEGGVAASDVENSLLRSLGTSDSQVSYENIVEDYCRRDPSVLEDGLKLYRAGRTIGIQVNADGRFIDILAVAASGDFVVIEFKRSQADDKVLGQISYYMSWVRRNLAKPAQRVRGIIIGHSITRHLREAASENRDIELKQYKVRIDFVPEA